MALAHIFRKKGRTAAAAAKVHTRKEKITSLDQNTAATKDKVTSLDQNLTGRNVKVAGLDRLSEDAVTPMATYRNYDKMFDKAKATPSRHSLDSQITKTSKSQAIPVPARSSTLVRRRNAVASDFYNREQIVHHIRAAAAAGRASWRSSDGDTDSCSDCSPITERKVISNAGPTPRRKSIDFSKMSASPPRNSLPHPTLCRKKSMSCGNGLQVPEGSDWGSSGASSYEDMLMSRSPSPTPARPVARRYAEVERREGSRRSLITRQMSRSVEEGEGEMENYYSKLNDRHSISHSSLVAHLNSLSS